MSKIDKPMKQRPAYLFFSVFFVFVSFSQPYCWAQQQETLLFDFDWRFHRGGAQGAEQPAFDDTGWRTLDLPHDWSIEDLPGTSSPFDPDAIGQVSTGFSVGGTGWYRKTFTIPDGPQDKRVYIQFDGVYMNADIWLNGNHLGNHPYGYTSFWFDITEYLKPGAGNVIAVQVKNEGQNSRWYSGSGIYRHVWLKTVDPVHIAPWGTHITTPEVSEKTAKIRVKNKVKNGETEAVAITLVTQLFDADGKQVAEVKKQQEIAPGATVEMEQEGTVVAPQYWSPDDPTLYTAVSEVHVAGRLATRNETRFGIRTIAFDEKNGFQLNGKTLKLKGGCVHHDNGPLGARAYDRAEERRVELLKANGYNAIRCAHNPPSPAFLDACDRLGMLVIDEAFDMWIIPNNPHDYHLYFDKWWQRDVESMVVRDRNHPSIILWSIGNEIKGMETPEVVDVAQELADYVRQLDPTRPVTAAVNGVNERKDPFFAALDVGGYNYARDFYQKDHERHPARVMYGSESYPWEAYAYWKDTESRPWVIGDFVWTAFDYIGEASIGWRGYAQKQDFYPWTLAFCGDIDICGWKRPQSYYRDVLWSDKSEVSLFVNPPTPTFPPNPQREAWSIWHWHDAVADWNWEGSEGTSIEVSAYTSCEVVELFLNGTSLGKKAANDDNEYIVTWQVPYQAGTLEAIGYVGGKKVRTASLRTAGVPSQLKLTVDQPVLKADGQSLSYIAVELLDQEGNIHPKAEDEIHFEIDGPGEIIAVANANPMSTESFQQSQRKAWQGKCLVIVKSGKEPGEVTLRATAAGIRPAETTIQVRSASMAEDTPGNVYYLDRRGDDGNTGTASHPWKSLGRLNRANLQAGDTVYFAAGQTFEGTILLDSMDGGSASKPVVMTTMGKERAIIQAGNESAIVVDQTYGLVIRSLNLIGVGRKDGNTRDGLSVINSQAIVLDSLDIRGFQKSGLLVYASSNVNVQHVYAHENGAAGIAVSGPGSKDDSRDIYIAHCVAENNPGDPTNLTNHSGNGIVVGNCRNVTIAYCAATNNGWDMPRIGNGPVGIWAYDADSLVIEYCISYRNKTSPGGEDGGGFDLDGGVTNSVVQYCLSYENQGSGFGIFQYPTASPWYNNTFRYNVSENDGSVSAAGAGVYIWNGDGNGEQFRECYFHNNVIYNERGAALSFAKESNRKGFQFYNNIFVAKEGLIRGHLTDDRFVKNNWWSLTDGFNLDGVNDFEQWVAVTGQEQLTGETVGFNRDPGFTGQDTAMPTEPGALATFRKYCLPESSPLQVKKIGLGICK